MGFYSPVREVVEMEVRVSDAHLKEGCTPLKTFHLLKDRFLFLFPVRYLLSKSEFCRWEIFKV